jgi:hypothetical protein
MNNAQEQLKAPLLSAQKLCINKGGEGVPRTPRHMPSRSLMLTCLAWMPACLPIISSAQPVALTPQQLDQLVARIAPLSRPAASSDAYRVHVLGA